VKRCVFFLVIALLLLSCAHQKVSYLPIAYKELLFQKKDNVFSLWWKGKVDIKTSNGEMSANIIVVAQKDPLCIRVELTNWLCGTIAYGFIKKGRFVFLSLKEKKAYIGKLPAEIKQKYIWAIVRTAPVDIDASCLVFQDGKIMLITKKFKISFKDYFLRKSTIFAKHISLLVTDTISLHAKVKRVEFNKDIPLQLFTPVIPSGFQILKYQVPTL